MKKFRLIFFIVATSLYCSVTRAQCPTGEISFSTQQQINDFSVVHPNCNDIPGNVTIGVPYGSSDILDLSPLKYIKSIGGHLNILNNPELKTLKGLGSLLAIEDYLNIYNNDGLMNLDGLHSLSSVSGNLWVINNSALTSLKGLQNLKSINGSIDIVGNTSLSSMEGLLNIDPGTIMNTLDYLMVQTIDVRIEGNGNITADDLSDVRYYLAGMGPVKRFQNMAQKPYPQRAVETSMLYRHMEAITDSVEAYRIFDQLERIARDSKDRNIRLELELLKTNYQLKNGSGTFPERIAHMQALADRFGQEGMRLMEARALKFISFIYIVDFHDYEKLFKTYHSLEQIIAQLYPEEFPDMAQCYMIIGRTHYRFRDYHEAIHYFRKAAAIPQTLFNATFVMHSRNNLGLCYQKLILPDSSDYYFKNVLSDTTSYPVEVWKGIASGNLGYNHYLRGEYEDAIPLLQRDIQTATSMDDWGLATGSLIPLADIRLKQNELQQAGTLLNQARKYIQLSHQTDRLRLLFPVLSKWHAAMGHKTLAADYIDSAQLATRDYNDKFNALKLLRARQELNAKQLLLTEVERQRLYQQRNLIIAIVLSLLVLLSIFMWYRTKNLRHKREIREMALKNARNSLENARSRLADQAQKIRENATVIHQLQQDFHGHVDPSVLMELKNSTFLTSEDWILFKENFRQAYPGFLETLETRYPELTPAETRCLCLMKLELTKREMATAQAVSPKSINVTTYRIRKKLNVETQEILEKMVSEIE